MPKKLDRFERAVEKHVHTDEWNIPVIYADRATKLLRAEHAWMRRQVRAYLQSSIDTGYVVACSEILSALAQRRK